MLGPLNFWDEKNLGTKNVGSKKCSVQKYGFRKKIWAQNFLRLNNFGSKNIKTSFMVLKD